MNKEQFLDLLEKFHQQSLNEKEIDLFLDAVRDPELEKLMTDNLYEELGEFRGGVDGGSDREQKVWNALTQNLGINAPDKQTKPIVKRMTIKTYRWWVAAMVLFFVTGIYLWKFTKPGKERDKEQAIKSKILPGSDGAILTLADGSSILLDTIKDGVVALQGGIIAKVKDGMLQYSGAGTEAVINTMTTPAGRQFKLALPDGTEVWLNAASSIRFPTAFTGNERKVEITGEAYFEVAKQVKQPFRITVNNGLEVEVLGTNVNVNSYQNEPDVKTTLLSGAVKIIHKSKQVILQPGQQASCSNAASKAGTSEQLEVIDNVNLEKVMAWKNGSFDFQDASLEEVMRQLERWYDIEVKYENDVVPNVHFFGGISRKESIDQVLKALEESKVKFKMQEGRKLIVLAP